MEEEEGARGKSTGPSPIRRYFEQVTRVPIWTRPGTSCRSSQRYGETGTDWDDPGLEVVPSGPRVRTDVKVPGPCFRPH